MHYSQTPWPSEWPQSSPSGVPGPYKALAVTDCVGCHSGNSAIKTVGSSKIPIVFHTNDPVGTGPGNTLAGGDFYWVHNGNDATGHNVKGVAGQDANIGLNPPGWDPTATANNNFGQVAGGANPWPEQLTCAGTYGCHGNHSNDLDANGVTDNFEAIYGAHHADDSMLKADTVNETLQGTSVGTSYRFLGGIHGIEDADWEYTASSSDHNEYKGVDGNANYADKTTISYLCAECHGYYHSGIGGHPAWLRHPTDIALPTTGEYGAVYGTAYNPIVPFGESNLDSGVQTTVNSTGNIVLCISCHRAHGSEYFKIMRWNYQGSVFGEKCSVCHTEKN